MITPRTEFRLYEMIPGALVWITIIGSILLSFFAPLVAIVFIIIFDLYWLLRVIYFGVNLTIAWWHLKETRKVDWRAKMETVPLWEQKVHMILLPTYKEEKAVVFHTLNHLRISSYPSEKMVIVLAGEERDQENFLKIAQAAQKEFADVFRAILITVHPKNLAGELPGKGSNLHFVGPHLKTYADVNAIKYADIIVSAFDVDTLADSHYFSYLTYVYCTHPNPTRSSYQPVPLYHNNMWNVSSVARIMSFGTTFWMLSEITRPQRLWTFSSHSMSLHALIDVGYWQKNLVSEDSRIFLQMILRYDGQYEVTPLYLPVSMDTVTGASWFASVKNIYKQQRRWAWGVENFPFMLWHFRRNKNIPGALKRRMIWNYAEGMFSWAVASVLILVLGRLPLYVGGAGAYSSILFQNAPFVLEQLMQYAMLGLFLSAGLSFTLLPSRPAHISFRHYGLMALQWLLLPITLLGLGALPAIDAQTKLMRGKYLGFDVTQKRKI